MVRNPGYDDNTLSIVGEGAVVGGPIGPTIGTRSDGVAGSCIYISHNLGLIRVISGGKNTGERGKDKKELHVAIVASGLRSHQGSLLFQATPVPERLIVCLNNVDIMEEKILNTCLPWIEIMYVCSM